MRPSCLMSDFRRNRLKNLHPRKYLLQQYSCPFHALIDAVCIGSTILLWRHSLSCRLASGRFAGQPPSITCGGPLMSSFRANIFRRARRTTTAPRSQPGIQGSAFSFAKSDSSDNRDCAFSAVGDGVSVSIRAFCVRVFRMTRPPPDAALGTYPGAGA